jgi:hypothetical protein
MVDTMEHAIDLSGFLNWCGLEDLSPVADLHLPGELVDEQARARQAAGHEEGNGRES